MKHFLSGVATLATAVLLACCLAVPCFAQEVSYAQPDDLDEIVNYDVTVEPQEDGTADITYKIHWRVVGGGSDDYLYWVKIGLANGNVDSFENLTPDTVLDVSYMNDDGDYARVTFKQHYYAPSYAEEKGGKSDVEFAFKVHQSHLYTLNEDNTASFVFTPGWFTDLAVDNLTVRWKNYEGFVADNTSTDGDYLVWEFGPVPHGESRTLRVTVPVTTAQVYSPDTQQTADDWGQGGGTEEGDIAIFVMALLVLALIVFTVSYLSNRWSVWTGGLGTSDSLDGFIYYSNGLHTIHQRPGTPPPAGYRVVSAPRSGFRAGGGSTRGGGATRSSGSSTHHSSCACACASSCACACACAGGGRAGCSVKNIYTVHLRTGAEDNAVSSDEKKES